MNGVTMVYDLYFLGIISTSAETILTLKNCELIHFGILRQGFVEKESILGTRIDSCIDTRFIFTLYDT